MGSQYNVKMFMIGISLAQRLSVQLIRKTWYHGHVGLQTGKPLASIMPGRTIEQRENCE